MPTFQSRWTVLYLEGPTQCTEVCFVSVLSGGFTTMAVINPPERKLAKSTSVQWGKIVSRVACLFFSLIHFQKNTVAAHLGALALI